MNIGYAKREISIKLPVAMGGYAGNRSATSIHDPLWIKTIIIASHAFISLDLVAVDALLVDRVRKQIPSDYTFSISATHTHAGPAGTLDTSQMLRGMQHVFQNLNSELMDSLAEGIVICFEDALEKIMPGNIAEFSGNITDVWSNRHDKNRLINVNTWGLIINTDIATLLIVVIPCHATVLPNTNTQISADLFGAIERASNVDFIMILNGASGDISTRFIRKSNTVEEMNRLGLRAWQKIQHLYQSAKPVIADTIKVWTTNIECKTRILEPFNNHAYSQLEAEIKTSNDALIHAQYQGMTILKQMTGIHLPKTITLSIQMIQIASIQLAFIPGELFSSLAFDTAHAITTSNGYFAYFSDKRGFEEKRYEALTSLIAEGEAEKIKHIIDKQGEPYGNN